MVETDDAIKPRDNFSDAVKNRLAAEVGYRCSLPDCGAPTIGPSTTEPKGFSYSGVAAHIAAAAPGGPRSNPSLSPTERSSYENGIHCCAKHGRIVDNDPTTYTAAQLRAWKTEAIDLQRRAHSTGDIDPNGRIKLARVTRHEIATRAVKASIRCRAAIMTGLAVTDQLMNLRSASMPATRIVSISIDKWAQEATRADTDVNEVCMDIRVSWGIKNGEPAGLQPLLSLLSCLREWLTRFNEHKYRVMQRLARTGGVVLGDLPTTVRSDGPQDCHDWAGVLSGDESERQSLQVAIDHDASRVESWAETFIVSRDG